jgi:hypothetical protein
MLRNTGYAYGVAIFTGKQTKLMMNSRYVGVFKVEYND